MSTGGWEQCNVSPCTTLTAFVDFSDDAVPVAQNSVAAGISVQGGDVLDAVVCCAIAVLYCGQGCQMAKFDPFRSLDCARVEGVGAKSKERMGSNFAA